MADFIQHTAETAPEGGADALDRARNTFGLVPNLVATLAESPTTAEAYLDLHERFAASAFSPVEQQVVALTASFENECHYCMAAESAVAKMVGADDATIEALRSGDELADERLEALRGFTRTVVRTRGWAGDEAVADFIASGFSKAQVLEVVLGVAKKTISNYSNHLADTPVDEAFASFAWEGRPAAV